MANSRKEKKSIGIMKWIIPGIALLGYLGFTLVGYGETMKSNSQAKAIDRISKQAIMISSYYEGVLDTRINAAEAVAGYCMDEEDVFESKNAEYLRSLGNSMNLRNAYIVKSDGSAMDMDGNVIEKAFSKSDYEMITGDTDIVSSIVDENGAVSMIISAPIRTEFEKKGTVVFEFVPEEISHIIEMPSYNYCLIYDNGLIADRLETGSSFFALGGNLHDMLAKNRFLTGGAESMKKNMSVGKAGYVEIDTLKGEQKFLIYQPLKKYSYSVVVAVNSVAIERSTYDENLETQNVILKIFVSASIFFGLIILIYIISRIASTKENRELQNKAETDLLTDLYNKMSTERKIREYLESDGKGKTNMMCVLDIDNFKKINDTMGHAFGDEVLSTLGKRLKSEFRVTDIIGRMGGDEFVIFLKDVKDDTIISREANRVEEFFKNFQVGTYTKYSATASIGVAIYPKDAQDYDALYKASDSALYTAKKRGKNQLAFFGDGVIEKDDDDDEDDDE